MWNNRSSNLDMSLSYKKGLLFVLSAPAGTGKTTLVQKLTQERTSIVESISYTTREPRNAEIDGTHYFFITKKEFEKKIEQGEFLEHVQLFGHYYGTSKKWLEDAISQGKHVFLVIDTQGALQLMKEKVNAIFIFVSPPSLEQLKIRLLKRKSENKQTLEERLSIAEKEISCAPYYDYHFINDTIENAYFILKSIVTAEEHRIRNKHIYS